MQIFRRIRLFLASLVLLPCGCEQEFAPGDIGIEFQFDTYEIDLNVADNPYITCVINSETGLRSVATYTLREDGTRVRYKDPVTEFFNARSYSLYERPVYDDSMTAFLVVAEDLGGRVVEKRAELHVAPFVSAPEIRFEQEVLRFAEGDPFPDFAFGVEAKVALKSIGVELVENGDATSFLEVDPFDGFSGETSFRFDSRNFIFREYDLTKIPSALRITVTDTYDKVSIAVLPLEYKALPAPVLKVDPVAAVDEYAPCVVSGDVESSSGIVEIAYYVTGDGCERLAATQTFDAVEQLHFSCTIDGARMRDYITGIRVEARDARSKVTKSVVPVAVAPVYTEVAAGEDLAARIREQFDDEETHSVKLRLAPGATYSLGGSSLTVAKRLLLAAGEGEQPVITSSAARTFLTDGADVSEVRFEGICFRSTASSSNFMGNNSSAGCSVGEIVVRGCRFEGYTQAFYNCLVAGSNIGSITLDDCVLDWKNTSGAYALFHFSKDADRIGGLKITDSTLSGVYYLLYNNLKMTDRSFALEVSQCTFVNSKGSANGYFVSFQNASQKGSITLRKLLFGGSNNVKGNYRMLRKNGMTAVCEDNYCTPGWKTFVDDSTNGSVNFLTTLAASEDNAQLFRNVAGLDCTVTPGTTVHVNRIGDPRWLK